MAKKKNKLSTPQWILEGYDSPEDYEKVKGKSVKKKKSGEKTFKIKVCPKCNSDNVGVVVGKEIKDFWECRDCNWKGTEIIEKELNEDELMEFLDKKGEEVA